jgi:hypothetical protein
MGFFISYKKTFSLVSLYFTHIVNSILSENNFQIHKHVITIALTFPLKIHGQPIAPFTLVIVYFNTRHMIVVRHSGVFWITTT